MNWEHAADVKNDLKDILSRIAMPHVDLTRVVAFRSYGSSSRARARIWSFPKIWQQALNLPAHYVLEVLSEKYDRLSHDDRKRVLIHELLHIPKNFSGSLRPHKAHQWRLDHHLVEKYFKEYKTGIKGTKKQ
ncbi:MAG TPA: putative metallopeptidase [Patescibacteria group bacterium]|nr:putative metallopeptidase [Patescibacteria group bacterium]